MSIHPRRLATAFIVQLALFSPEFSFAGRFDQKDNSNNPPKLSSSASEGFNPRSRSSSGSPPRNTLSRQYSSERQLTSPSGKLTPSGSPMVIRRSPRALFRDRDTEYDYLDKIDPTASYDSWAACLERGEQGSFTISDGVELVYGTLPHDFDHEGFYTLNGDYLEEKDSHIHEMALGREKDRLIERSYLDHLKKGLTRFRDLKFYLTPPKGFNVKAYWSLHRDKIIKEYLTLEDVHHEYLPTLSAKDMMAWSLEDPDEAKLIKMVSIRHFYNLGAHDHVHHESGNPSLPVEYRRSALAYMDFPKDFQWDWRGFRERNPKVERVLIAHAHDAANAVRAQHYALDHGFHDGSLVEGVEEGFPWRLYLNLLQGLSNSSSESEGSSIGTSLNYHLNEIPEYPASQDLDRPEVRAQMFALAFATQKHFVKYSEELGLRYPFLPEAFDAMEYLEDKTVMVRFKKISGTQHWTEWRKRAWAESDWWMRMYDKVRFSDSNSSEEDNAHGFPLPMRWTLVTHLQHNWKAKVANNKMFPTDRFKDIKRLAWLQADVFKAWSEKGEEQATPDEHSRFAAIPAWFDVELYFRLNPTVETKILEALKSAWSGETWDEFELETQQMLLAAEAQDHYAQTRKRHLLVPSQFQAAEYFELNETALEIPEQYRTSTDIEMWLEHHYATQGMQQGLPYVRLSESLQIPNWVDEDHYFSQAWDLQMMAQDLGETEKQLLLRQHFFTEGLNAGFSLAPVPEEIEFPEYFDEDLYAVSSRELTSFLESLGPIDRETRRSLIRQHYYTIGILQAIEFVEVPESFALPTWADKDYYFSQARNLHVMLRGLKPTEQDRFMKRHFFAEGLKAGYGLAKVPISFQLPAHFDTAFYLSQTPDFAKFLESLEVPLSETRRNTLIRQHYYTVGRSAGTAFVEVPSGFKLPNWANLEHYMAQASQLKELAKGLDTNSRKILMRQHFFVEGAQKGYSLTKAPKEFQLNPHFDHAFYLSQVPEFEQFMRLLGKLPTTVSEDLFRQHYYQVGRRTGTPFVSVPKDFKMPDWADLKHYLAQAPQLEESAKGLRNDPQSTLMRQHFFVEGAKAGHTLVNVPTEFWLNPHFDHAFYLSQVPEFEQFMGLLRNLPTNARNNLVRQHYYKVGIQKAIPFADMPETFVLPYNFSYETYISGSPDLLRNLQLGHIQGGGALEQLVRLHFYTIGLKNETAFMAPPAPLFDLEAYGKSKNGTVVSLNKAYRTEVGSSYASFSPQEQTLNRLLWLHGYAERFLHTGGRIFVKGHQEGDTLKGKTTLEEIEHQFKARYPKINQKKYQVGLDAWTQAHYVAEGEALEFMKDNVHDWMQKNNYQDYLAKDMTPLGSPDKSRQKEGTSVHVLPGSRPGLITSGPRVALEPGRYRVELTFNSSGSPDGNLAGSWQVRFEGQEKALYEGDLKAQKGDRVAAITLAVGEKDGPLVVNTHGIGANLVIHKLTIQQASE